MNWKWHSGKKRLENHSKNLFFSVFTLNFTPAVLQSWFLRKNGSLDQNSVGYLKNCRMPSFEGFKYFRLRIPFLDSEFGITCYKQQGFSNSLRMWVEFCAHCNKDSDQKSSWLCLMSIFVCCEMTLWQSFSLYDSTSIEPKQISWPVSRNFIFSPG